MRRPALACLAVAALLVTGCDDAGPAAAPAASAGPAGAHDEWDVTRLPDPCRLLRGAEVRRVLGEPVDTGERLETWPPLCAVRVPGPPAGFLYVSDDTGPTGRADFDRQRSDPAATRPVPGVGDEAYWLPEMSALHVWAGDTHVAVKFAGDRIPAQPLAKATALALLVLPRARPAAGRPSAGGTPADVAPPGDRRLPVPSGIRSVTAQ